MTNYFENDTGYDTAVAQLAVDRVRDALTACITSLPAGVVHTINGQVDTINQVNGELTGSFNVTQRTVTGTGSASILPTATAMCVVWVTNGFVNSRRVIGKTYLSPMILGLATAAGIPSAGLVTALQAFGDAMDNPGATPVRFVVWARPFAGDDTVTPAKPARDGTTHDVVGNRVNSKFAVLRSRRD